jgi:hypothetical protein
LRTYCGEVGSREAVAGAFFGAVVMVAVSVVFARLAGGPGDEDWTHSAVLLAPFAAIFGAVAGAVGGLILRVTRPPARRSPYSSRTDRRDGHDKRKR